jgi:hypothetical protein
MGGDSFPNIRYLHRRMLGGCAHLPEFEGVCSKMIEFGFQVHLYRFPEVIHRLTFFDVDGKGLFGRAEKPAEEG